MPVTPRWTRWRASPSRPRDRRGDAVQALLDDTWAEYVAAHPDQAVDENHDGIDDAVVVPEARTSSTRVDRVAPAPRDAGRVQSFAGTKQQARLEPHED